MHRGGTSVDGRGECRSRNHSRMAHSVAGARRACPPGRPRPAARPSESSPVHGHGRPGPGAWPPPPRRRRQAPPRVVLVAPSAAAGAHSARPPGAKHRDRSLHCTRDSDFGRGRLLTVALTRTRMARYKPEHGQRGRAQFLRACCHGKLPRPGGLVDRDSSWRIFCPVHWFLVARADCCSAHAHCSEEGLPTAAGALRRRKHESRRTRRIICALGCDSD